MRAAPYLIGIALGYIIHKTRTNKIKIQLNKVERNFFKTITKSAKIFNKSISLGLGDNWLGNMCWFVPCKLVRDATFYGSTKPAT